MTLILLVSIRYIMVDWCLLVPNWHLPFVSDIGQRFSGLQFTKAGGTVTLSVSQVQEPEHELEMQQQQLQEESKLQAQKDKDKTSRFSGPLNCVSTLFRQSIPFYSFVSWSLFLWFRSQASAEREHQEGPQAETRQGQPRDFTHRPAYEMICIRRRSLRTICSAIICVLPLVVTWQSWRCSCSVCCLLCQRMFWITYFFSSADFSQEVKNIAEAKTNEVKAVSLISFIVSVFVVKIRTFS